MYAISWMTLGYPRIFVCPLDSLSAFYAWHDVHARPFSTDRRRYAQQPLHRAAFIRTCSYTEKLLHTDASISYTKAFTQSISLCFFPMLCLKTGDVVIKFGKIMINHWMEWLVPIFRHPSHIACIFFGCFLMSTRWCPTGSVVGL